MMLNEIVLSMMILGIVELNIISLSFAGFKGPFPIRCLILQKVTWPAWQPSRTPQSVKLCLTYHKK